MSAKWIWPADGCAGINTYAKFRRKFHAAHPEGRWAIRISVAGNYALKAGGVVAAFGQYTDWPSAKTFTETDLTPYVGDGGCEIEINAWYSSNRFSSHFDGEPGLWAEILHDGEVVDATSRDWLAAPDTRFAFGERTILFVSLNYTFAFDANATPPAFAPAAERPDLGRPVPRPTPPPVDMGFARGEPVSSGDGYAVFDLGEERTGLLQFTLAAGGGERLEIVHGEYLADGRLRDFTIAGNPANPRSVVDTYVCKPGRQTFAHYLRRLGCRFIEFRSPRLDSVKIESAGLRVVGHKGLETPSFSCSDKLFETMHEISCRTLRCCLHEKYENCPWREQSICAYDARNQMLFGYTTWGNYGHAAAMIRLFAKCETESGYLTATAPSASRTIIPMFTFPWVASVCEHCLHSGSDALFDELSPQIERMLGKILSYRKDGLYIVPEIDGYWVWNYCEPYDLEFCDASPAAFYNLYLREALVAVAPLLRHHGRAEVADRYEATAREIAAKACETFWDPDFGAYANAIGADGVRKDFYGHIQSLFLAQGLVPADRRAKVIGAIRSGKVKFQELASLPYLVEGVFSYGTDDDREWLHAKIRELYARQIDAGATTWWEVHDGTAYAGGGGSLCHGWSAMPLWYETRHILGARPTSPGWRTYEAKPHPLGGITSASGTVMTPRGPIALSFRNDGKH